MTGLREGTQMQMINAFVVIIRHSIEIILSYAISDLIAKFYGGHLTWPFRVPALQSINPSEVFFEIYRTVFYRCLFIFGKVSFKKHFFAPFFHFSIYFMGFIQMKSYEACCCTICTTFDWWRGSVVRMSVFGWRT